MMKIKKTLCIIAVLSLVVYFNGCINEKNKPNNTEKQYYQNNEPNVEVLKEQERSSSAPNDENLPLVKNTVHKRVWDGPADANDEPNEIVQIVNQPIESNIVSNKNPKEASSISPDDEKIIQTQIKSILHESRRHLQSVICWIAVIVLFLHLICRFFDALYYKLGLEAKIGKFIFGHGLITVIAIVWFIMMILINQI